MNWYLLDLETVYHDHNYDFCRRMFYYKLEACAWEIIMMMLMPMIDYIRQKLASQGNKTEQWNVLLWSVILTAPLIVGHVFFLRLQYYVYDEIYRMIY